jgi:ketosteroid isomerase-like protein
MTDREEIIAHIHSIFQAYLRKDRAAIREARTPDWTGFQGPSVKIERGIEDYMANAEKSLQHLDGTGFELLDTEVQIYGEIGIVYYVARYDFRDNAGVSGSLPLRAIDIYRKDPGGWIQIGSHITPIPQGGNWGQG